MRRGWCDDEATCIEARPLPAVHSSAAGLPIQADLSAGLVPLSEFPLRKWYFAADAPHPPRWYYHAPALEHRLRDDPEFYELVDPPLRELCRLVRDAGLCTTPSCSGHFYAKERFARIWDDLQRESRAIRHDGLELVDSESGAGVRFRNAAYTLPWQEFGEFHAQVDALQRQGYVGLAIPPARTGLVQRLASDAFATPAARIIVESRLGRLFGQPVFGVYVDAESTDERDATWAEVTGYLRGVLRARE